MTCHERKRVLLKDNIKSVIISSLVNKYSVCCNILIDRTSVYTWCHIAIKVWNLFIGLSVRKRLNRLNMMLISSYILCKLLKFCNIYSGPNLNLRLLKLLSHLVKSLISARLKDSGCHRYRPDSAVYNLIYIEVITTARVCNSKLSVKAS